MGDGISNSPDNPGAMATEAPVKKGGLREGFSGLFRRGQKPQPSPEPVSPAPQTPEAQGKNETEVLKTKLTQEIAQLADLQLNILGRKSNISPDGLNRPFVDKRILDQHNAGITENNKKTGSNEPTDNAWDFTQKYMAETAKMEVLKKEVSKKLIADMEAAKAKLGDFCAVVTEGENKAVVILSPIESKVRRTVYANQAQNLYNKVEDLEKNALYDTEEATESVYFVNPDGLQVLDIPQSRKITPRPALGNPENKWVVEGGLLKKTEGSGDLSVNGAEKHTSDVNGALYGAINNMPDIGSGPQHPGLIEDLRYRLTRMPTRQANTDSNRYIKFADSRDISTGGFNISQAVTGLDAQVAIADSIDQAQAKKAAQAKGAYFDTKLSIYDSNHRIANSQ